MDAGAIHGWVPEPDGRGTWSILWSCLVTISICTWSSLHLNVSKPRHSSHSVIVRKILWSLLAAMAPEYILWTSASDHFKARRSLRYLALKQKQQEWTMTHFLFAFANGFWVRTPNGHESQCDAKQLRDLIISNRIRGPPISKDELKSRAKADWTVKLIAVIQIIWFLVQIIARAAQHYHITSLEILTAAFVFCSIFIYAFSFQKPQDVEFPVFIDLPDTKHDITEPNSAPDLDESGMMLHNMAATSQEDSTKKDEFDPDEAGSISLKLLAILGCVFGAIHCIAWNFPFPTSQERLAWRICSAATVVIPGLICIAFMQFIHIIVCIGCFCNAGAFFTGYFVQVIYHSVALAYILGRMTLVILAFIGLRTLPPDAFRTVDWNKYFPHFAN